MTDLSSLFGSFSAIDREIIYFFSKAFAILFSFLFLLYAVIITRQTQVMNRTVTGRYHAVIFLISLGQVFLAFFLLFLSLVVL